MLLDPLALKVQQKCKGIIFMRENFNFLSHVLCLGLLMTGLFSCSQSRSPLVTHAGSLSQEINQLMCRSDDTDPNAAFDQVCFTLRLDYQNNSIWVQFNFNEIDNNAYRVYARHRDGDWERLTEDLYNIEEGGVMEIITRNSDIEGYVDWYVELAERVDGLTIVPVAEYDFLNFQGILDTTVVDQSIGWAGRDGINPEISAFDPFEGI